MVPGSLGPRHAGHLLQSALFPVPQGPCLWRRGWGYLFEDLAPRTLGSVASARSWCQALHSSRGAALGGAGWPAPARPLQPARSARLGRAPVDAATSNSARCGLPRSGVRTSPRFAVSPRLPPGGGSLHGGVPWSWGSNQIFHPKETSWAKHPPHRTPPVEKRSQGKGSGELPCDRMIY